MKRERRWEDDDVTKQRTQVVILVSDSTFVVSCLSIVCICFVMRDHLPALHRCRLETLCLWLFLCARRAHSSAAVFAKRHWQRNHTHCS